MQDNKKNIIVDMSFEFTLNVIEYVELLEKHFKFVIARQLLKSGSSIGANVREAQNAESKVDFIHKIKIAAKEADETSYWLEVCKAAKTYPSNEKLLLDIKVIIKILSKIISSSKKRKE